MVAINRRVAKPFKKTSVALRRAWNQHFLRVSFTEDNGKRLCFANETCRLKDFYQRQACHFYSTKSLQRQPDDCVEALSG